MKYRRRILELGGNGSAAAASELAVRAFEKRFQLNLPTAYRAFLRECGGSTVRVVIGVREPTPFGSEVAIDRFLGFCDDPRDFDDIRRMTEHTDTAPAAIPIGDNLTGH